MKRSAVMAMVSFGAMLMFSGCSNNGFVDARMLTKDNKTKGIRVINVGIPNTDTHGYKDYAEPENADYRCYLRASLYTIAKEALERGYPYFSLYFPDGSNKMPPSIVGTEKIFHYCVPGYYDKDTDLLDDKCGHIGFGTGTPAGVTRIDGVFYKKRNPFVPMWDAKKIMQELEPALLRECWGNRKEVFEKVLKGHNDFGEIELD